MKAFLAFAFWIVAAQSQFVRNVRDVSELFSSNQNELEGVPEPFINRAAFIPQYPTYVPPYQSAFIPQQQAYIPQRQQDFALQKQTYKQEIRSVFIPQQPTLLPSIYVMQPIPASFSRSGGFSLKRLSENLLFKMRPSHVPPHPPLAPVHETPGPQPTPQPQPQPQLQPQPQPSFEQQPAYVEQPRPNNVPQKTYGSPPPQHQALAPLPKSNLYPTFISKIQFKRNPLIQSNRPPNSQSVQFQRVPPFSNAYRPQSNYEIVKSISFEVPNPSFNLDRLH